jgi:hypothetical protein
LVSTQAKTTCVLLSLPKDDYNRITAAATAEDQIIRAKHLAACPIFLTWPARRLAARTATAASGRPDRTFEMLGHIDVVSADAWTNRSLSSSSRRTVDVRVSKHSLAVKSGRRFEVRAGASRT